MSVAKEGHCGELVPVSKGYPMIPFICASLTKSCYSSLIRVNDRIALSFRLGDAQLSLATGLPPRPLTLPAQPSPR